MSPKLYVTKTSPPCRATVLTIKALGIEVDFEEINLWVKEQFKPEFLELNPLHTVPTLQDGAFVTWDSHVINAYLVEKYGKTDSLYSKDVEKRAIVDQRLYFDDGILFPRFADVARTLLGGAEKTINKDKAEVLVEAYAFLEALIGKNKYVAGDELSIADFSIIASITSSILLVPIDAQRFPKITAWIARMEALPYYAEGNQKGLDMLAGIFKDKF